MKRNWVSAVILLVITLSTVKATPFHIYKGDLHKRAVDIGPCKEPSTIELKGKVDPDPKAGEAAEAALSFVAGDAYEALFLTTTVSTGDPPAPIPNGVKTAKLCVGDFKCPVTKGQPINIKSTTDIPDGTASPFQIEYNINDGAKVVSCGVAKAAGGGAAGGGAGGGAAGGGDGAGGGAAGGGDGAGGGAAGGGDGAGGGAAGGGDGAGGGAAGGGAAGGGDGAGGGAAGGGDGAGGGAAGGGDGAGGGGAAGGGDGAGGGGAPAAGGGGAPAAGGGGGGGGP